MAMERLLRLLNENSAVYVVIGATAFPAYGYARATLDIDLFVKSTRPNIRRVMKALREFGYGLSDFSENDFLTHKILIRQYLLETDIHPFVKGIVFGEVWENRITSKIGKTEVYFPSLEDMIRMKKAAGRIKDREDLKFLKKLLKKKSEAVP
ncbi:MAG: nucleotidyltransferase [Candidatus Aminicenantes bacterium]|nr:nucleotidyltransferase [Candidatus Aminicenantes bacterium]